MKLRQFRWRLTLLQGSRLVDGFWTSVAILVETYHYCQQWLNVVPEITPIAEDLFLAIDLNCKHWIYPSPEWRMEVVIFSRGFPK